MADFRARPDAMMVSSLYNLHPRRGKIALNYGTTSFISVRSWLVPEITRLDKDICLLISEETSLCGSNQSRILNTYQFWSLKQWQMKEAEMNLNKTSTWDERQITTGAVARSVDGGAHFQSQGGPSARSKAYCASTCGQDHQQGVHRHTARYLLLSIIIIRCVRSCSTEMRPW